MNPAFHTGCFFSFLPFFFSRNGIHSSPNGHGVCNLAFTIHAGRHILGDCRELASKQARKAV